MKKSGIESEASVRWFLLDDIYIWVKCRMSNCDNKHNEGANEPVHTPDAHTEQNDQGKQPTAPEDKIVQNNSTNHGDEGKNTQPAQNSTTSKVATEAVKASKCGAPGLTPAEKEDCELEEKVKAAKKKEVDNNAARTTGSRQKEESTKPKDMTAGISKKDDQQTDKETKETAKGESVEAAQKKRQAAKKK